MGMLLFSPPKKLWTPKNQSGLEWWLSSDFGLSNKKFMADFNGSNQSLSVVDNANLSVGDMKFWVAAEVIADSFPSTFPVVAGKNAATSANLEWDLHVDQANSRFRFQTGGAAFRQVSEPTVLVFGQRYFVFGYHDNTADQNGISLDGGAFTTATTSGTEPTDTTSGLRVGARNGTPDRFWDGAIGNLWFGKAPTVSFTTIKDRIWNSGNPIARKDLTAQEITDFGIVPFYPLDEASGQRNDINGTNHLTSNNSVGRRELDVTLNANEGIYKIIDRSSALNHAIQEIYNNRPTKVLNAFGSKPGIAFDGIKQFFIVTSFAITADVTLSMTIKVSATPGAYFGHSTGTGKIVQTDATTLTITNDAGSSLVITHDTLDANTHDVTLVRENNVWTRRVDDLEDGTGTLAGTITLDRIGVVGASTSFLSGTLADIIRYGRAYS